MNIEDYQIAGIASAAAAAQEACGMYSVHYIALELTAVHQHACKLHEMDEVKANTGRLHPLDLAEQKRLRKEVTKILKQFGAKHVAFPGNPLARPVQVEFVTVENPDSHHFTHQFG